MYRNRRRLLEALNLDGAAPDQCQQIIVAAEAITTKLGERAILEQVLHRATLSPDTLRIEVKRGRLERLLVGDNGTHCDADETLIAHTVPLRCQRRGVEAKLVLPGSHSEGTNVDEHLIALIARAHRWFDQLARGEIGSVQELATEHNRDPSDVGRELQLAFLAPDIVEAILAGRQPLSLTTRPLRRLSAPPTDWCQQHRILGFAT